MKHGFTRRALAATVALGVGISLAACSSGSTGGGGGGGAGVQSGTYKGPKVTVTFWNGWTGGDQQTILAKLISDFNASHKKIVIKAVPLQWADISAKMPLAIKAGKGPDLTVAHGDDIATYAAQGLLVKSDAIVKDLGYSASDFPPGLFDHNVYQGAQYGIPWSVTPLGLYANKSVLKKAGLDTAALPTDKASYLKALDALKGKGIQGEWVDGFVFTGTFEFESLLWQYGGDLFNKDASKATFNSPAGVKALTWMVDLIKKGHSPAKVAQDGNINALIAGKTAFNWNGIWQTSNTALKKDDWTAAAVPQIGDQKAVWSSSTDWAFVNNKGQDKNKTQAAAEFVKWMNEHSMVWAGGGELPAANKVRNDAGLVSKYPALKPFLAEMDYAHFETTAPGIPNAEATITVAVNEAVLQKKSPKQALDDAVSKANQLLAQNKQQYGG
jgi:multiple sugar transport system substrate-binding protein